MESLPFELLDLIASLLPVADLINFAVSNRTIFKVSERHLLRCIRLRERNDYYNLFMLTHRPEGLDKVHCIQHLHLAPTFRENVEEGDQINYPQCLHAMRKIARELNYPEDHPLRKPCRNMVTVGGTCGAFLLLSLHRLSRLQCFQMPETNHAVVDYMLEYCLKTKGKDYLPFPGLPECPGLKKMKSVRMPLLLDIGRGPPKIDETGESWSFALPWFTCFPGMEHIMLHSATSHDFEFEETPVLPTPRSSTVKHLTFVNPCLDRAEIRLLLGLPRTLETIVIRADSKARGNGPMLLRDWREALLQHRKSLKLLVMLPVEKADKTGFVGCSQRQNDDPIEDSLGSLCEFERLETLIVSLVFLLGYTPWAAEPERPRARNRLSKGLKRLTICVEGFKSTRAEANGEWWAEGHEREVFEDVLLMVESGEWDKLELVRVLGCSRDKKLEWDRAVKRCQEFGVKLVYGARVAAIWDQVHSWEVEEEPMYWDDLMGNADEGRGQMCWPPGRSS